MEKDLAAELEEVRDAALEEQRSEHEQQARRWHDEFEQLKARGKRRAGTQCECAIPSRSDHRSKGTIEPLKSFVPLLCRTLYYHYESECTPMPVQSRAIGMSCVSQRAG